QRYPTATWPHGSTSPDDRAVGLKTPVSCLVVIAGGKTASLLAPFYSRIYMSIETHRFVWLC
ncbi:hypothetical protein, partial [Halorubrum sp. GN11GM_10-3_MGM]|uniref:hypothetical protein n=1 Tax=Halorubrum sp. GN11GM_10-3_MGM TaxID=2518111 RepID=UPI001A7E14DC